MRTYERARELHPPPMQGRKKCNDCGKWKHFDLENSEASEFQPQKKRRKNGEAYYYPKSYCRLCDQKRKKRSREKVKAEDPERWQEMQKRWRENYLANKGREHIRRLHRDWSAMRRRQEGRPVRGRWRRYRKEEKVPTGPFVELLQAMIADGWEITEIAYLGQSDESRLRRIINGEFRDGGKTYYITEVSVDLVDRVLLGTHSPLHLSDLYPELYED